MSNGAGRTAGGSPALVSGRDWEKVHRDYAASSLYRFAVLDDFLEEDACLGLRRRLLKHWGWRRKHWESEQLYNGRPNIADVFEIAETLRDCLPILIGGLQLVDHWGILYHTNVGLHPHADAGKVQFNLWLTPEEYNLDPTSGGLIFYDTRRASDQMVHEYGAASHCLEYLRQHTRGGSFTVPYRYNRGLVFDRFLTVARRISS
jgi:hypothetical protein